MPGFYRAYGQLRRGGGPWRTPFLIPLRPYLGVGEHWHFAIDAGAMQSDVDIDVSTTYNLFTTAFSYLRSGNLSFTFTVAPSGGRIVTDVSIRIVVLIRSNNLQVSDGNFGETGAQFAVFQLHLGPGTQLPTIKLTAKIEDGRIDPNQVDLARPMTVAAGGTAVSSISLILDPDVDIPLDVAGGFLDSANVTRLQGVETTVGPLGGYSEDSHDIRGVDLHWLDDPADPMAKRPTSATWVELADNAAQPAGQLKATLHTPTRPDRPTKAPSVQELAGGQMRIGLYRYRITHVDADGNESAAGDRSEPASVTGTKSQVHVAEFPSTEADIEKVRVYRTDTDRPSLSAKPEEIATQGDDVLVAELDSGATEYTDTGSDAAGKDAPPYVRLTDLVAVEYEANRALDLVGKLRMIDTDSDRVIDIDLSTPQKVRLVYQPGAEPALRWTADSVLASARLVVPWLGATGLGNGLDVGATQVPKRFDLSWMALGSEYFQFALAAGVAERFGRIGAVLGTPFKSGGWPEGDAFVAADLDPGGSLIALSELRSARIDSGAARWADRDQASARITLDAQFDDAGTQERDLRLRYFDPDPLTHLRMTGHSVPSRVHASVTVPANGPSVVDVQSRIRWLRAAFGIRKQALSMSGHIFLDDTTDRLSAEVSDTVRVDVASPVRIGGRIDIRLNEAPATIRPDIVLPASAGEGNTREISAAVTGLKKGSTSITAQIPEPGVSGRVAASWDPDPPLGTRATPQAKLLTHGAQEPNPDLRAITARLIGFRRLVIDPRVLGNSKPVSEELTRAKEVATIGEFAGTRANSSFRYEEIERESRVAIDPTPSAPQGARYRCRARVEHVPQRVSVTTAFVRDTSGRPTLGGTMVEASSPWGAGEVFAEPSYVWIPVKRRPALLSWDLGKDRGIGVMATQFDPIPARMEWWNLTYAVALGTLRVPSNLRLPTVGPVGANWITGGHLLRANGPIRLHWLRVATPGGYKLECRDDGPDHPVRHGTWTEFQAPFVTLEPSVAGQSIQFTYWDAKGPQSPWLDPGEMNPCEDEQPQPPARASAVGWLIDPSTRVTLALTQRELNTPSGPVKARWNSMPTSDEEWDGVDDPKTGLWWLKQTLQMEGYSGTVAIYPDENLDNPFGAWGIGPGRWWLRARDKLNVLVNSGDLYFGNVGGGYKILGSKGVHSTLPAIFKWGAP